MKCGAKLKQSEGTCRRVAGWGTDHKGEGKCKLHGGATPVKSGRYSRYSSKRLAERIAHFEADPEPLNLIPEVVMLRALVDDYIERYEEYRDALLAWNDFDAEEAAEEQRKPRPQRLLDIADARGLLVDVSKVVEKIDKQKASEAVTLAQVSEWFRAFGKVVAKYADPAAVAKIEAEWGTTVGDPSGSA